MLQYENSNTESILGEIKESTASINTHLDMILMFLRDDRPEFPCHSTEEVYHHSLISGMKASIHYIDSALIKLKKEGFISDDKILAQGMIVNGQRLDEAPNSIWFITFDGMLLLRKEKSDIDRSNKLNKHEIKIHRARFLKPLEQ